MKNTKAGIVKRVLTLFLAFVVASGFATPMVFANETNSGEVRYKDGVYDGVGSGRNEGINVNVSIEEGLITSIEVLSNNETPSYWRMLFAENGSNLITDRIISAQSTEVDVISGATMSSEGIKAAVNDALLKAEIKDEISIPGSGTERDPYVVRTAEQLAFFAGKVDEGDEAYTKSYVALGANIDLSEIENWNPIGAEGKANANKTKLFNGVFDGRGRILSGLKIRGDYSEEANAGLFSTLGSEAIVKNLTLRDVDIYVNENGSWANARAGGIAGDTQTSTSRAAIVDTCSVSGNIYVNASDGQGFAGGILGRAFSYAAIINSCSYANVEAVTKGDWNSAYAGGIAGMTGNNTVVANCASFGYISASNDKNDGYAGGIAGMLSSKSYNIYATGSVNGPDAARVGVIAGQLPASASGDKIYYASDVSVTVNGEASANIAYGEKISGMSEKSIEPKTSDELSGEDFAEELNSNIQAVIAALNESTLIMNEWIVENGKIVASPEPWVSSEPDAGIFESGSGSAEDPYMIGTKEQLAAFASSMNSKLDYSGKYIKLSDNIDISGGNWEPIGGSFYRFNGDFDGNGKTISGLSEGAAESPRTLDGESAYIGLFGWVNENARIHNLNLADVAIYTHSTGSAYLGGIAGRMSGSSTEGDYHGANIDRCTVKGVIEHKTDKGTSFIGGIAGHVFKGTIINSMTDVKMDARELSGELAEVGGMVGLLNRGMVANSYALGDIIGSGYRNTQYDIEGMACIGNIAAVNGGYIVNCYGQGGVEALEYSIDTGIISGWVTGIAKVYNSWYNLDARMVIDGRIVSPVDAFGETVAGGVSDEWGFKYPGSLIEHINGYHPASDMQKLVDGLNASFDKFPIDIEGIYGLDANALKKWTLAEGQAELSEQRANVTYEEPDVEKNLQDEPELKLQDGRWYGRSNDKTVTVSIDVKDDEIKTVDVINGAKSGEAYEEAVNRAKFKAKFGDVSKYDKAEPSKFKGSGTEADPYRVENESQLRYLADSINEDVDWQGKYFRQTKDIEVSGADWKPIGWGLFADADGDGFGQDVVALYPFKGNYDGNSYKITGLRAGSESKPINTNYMGLFGIIQGSYEGNEIPEDGYRATIKNVKLEDIAFYTENRWRCYIGGLVANAQGGFAIDNCRVSGIINSKSTEDFAFAGGLSGSLMYGSVINSMTDVDSSAWSGKNYSYAAGMSAVTNRSTIVNSYTLGDVHADADQTNRAEAGGFIALDGGICINCYAKGNVEIVSKYSMYMGGFAGMAASSSEHRQCYYNTDASQKVAGKEASEKAYAGKFVNESAEANAQAKSESEMSSDAFITLLEDNRTSISKTLSQVKHALGADDRGSSKYHSVYYNGDGSDLSKWELKDGVAVVATKEPIKENTSENPSQGGSGGSGGASQGGSKTDTKVSGGGTAKKAKATYVVVNVKTVNTKAIDNAIKKAGTNNQNVTKIVLGKKVKKIKKGTFKKYNKVTQLEIKSKKLKKSRVKGSLKASKISTVKVNVGSKKKNKKYIKKYKKIFTKKNAGKKAKVS